MDVVWRRMLCLLAVLFTAVAHSTAADPPVKPPAEKKAAEYADPKTTYRTYIEAVRKNDVKAAIRCWVIDDDNKSGALDTIVGLWISTRQLNRIAEKKFGAEGLDAIVKGWRRKDVTDPALDLTKNRVEDAVVKIDGDQAQLTVRWSEGDGGSNPAFMFSPEPVHFRKVDGNWKIDANRMTELKRGTEFFEKSTWGRMFRDQVVIMNEAIEGMEKDRLKTAKELGVFIDDKIALMSKKYEEEAKKNAPKGK